jgi:hypothetical protein
MGAGRTSPRGSLADTVQRLQRTEQALEEASTELERIRTERDFYRQLLEDPARRAPNQPGKE